MVPCVVASMVAPPPAEDDESLPPQAWLGYLVMLAGFVLVMRPAG